MLALNVRALLVVILVLCLALGWKVKRVGLRRGLVAVIQRGGGVIRISTQNRGGLARKIGDSEALRPGKASKTKNVLKVFC